MTTRRQFLEQSALVSLAPFVPGFLARSATAAELAPDERILVVIQLDGGNDGLNTVIPFADPLYARYRKVLRISPDKVLKLDNSVGLHPQMKAAAKLFEEGRLAIVQGVGYPNPNRSHFESMAIWHHARVSAEDHDGIGWLGRTADAIEQTKRACESCFVGAETLPVAVRGRRAASVSLKDESDLLLATPVAKGNQNAPDAADVAAFVQRSVAQSFDAARRFNESTPAKRVTSEGYPSSKLAEKLRLVSKLLKVGGPTRMFYVSQIGYDTHAGQEFPHQQLLSEFSAALAAFLNDLKTAHIEERVVVMAFSEFGRRVAENASGGTDHGVAGPVFLAGPAVNGGLIGKHPSLANLDQGDLQMSIDFRQVYAALLKHWLDVEPQPIVGQQFEPIACLNQV